MCPEQGKVTRQLLDIEPGGAAAAEMINQVEDAEFGGVVYPVEHAFAREDTGCAHAIESSHEIVVQPCLDAVRVTQPVQLDVGSDHGRSDPSAALIRPRHGRTRGDNGFKSLVDREANRAEAASCLAKIAGHVKTIEFEDRPSGRTNPWNRAERTGIRPGKDSMPIGRNQSFRRKVVIQRDKTEFVGRIGWRPFGSRHAVAWLECAGWRGGAASFILRVTLSPQGMGYRNVLRVSGGRRLARDL